jgi:tetratricopeptide (TPR) repeat protein
LNLDYLPAQLWLADLKLERGYYSWVIENLTMLADKYSFNSEIQLKLIDAYVRSGRLNKAQEKLNLMSQVGKISMSAEFSSLVGRVYLKKEKLPVALKSLNEALLRDPMRDNDYYLLAQIYFKYRKYDRCKTMLNKAMMLDPANIDYQTLYADILFDKDGADVAIGYLRSKLEKSPKTPWILSKIAGCVRWVRWLWPYGARSRL